MVTDHGAIVAESIKLSRIERGARRKNSQLPTCWRSACLEANGCSRWIIFQWPCCVTELVFDQNQNRKHLIELRFPSRSWNRNCGRVAFIDRACCHSMGCTPRLVTPAGLAACVHGINSSGRHVFSAGHWRTSRRQTADDSKTDCACTVDCTHPHWRSLRSISLCCGGKIVAHWNIARWYRRSYWRLCRLRH